MQLDELRRDGPGSAEERVQSSDMELTTRLGAKEAALRERDSHVDEVFSTLVCRRYLRENCPRHDE